ncbi:MAG: ATP synthase F1 subunit delta [Sedimentisphaerales bacterium]|jgi:F-type H+-transporting ATPase subunit delta
MNIDEKAVRLGQIYAQAIYELAEQAQLIDVLKNDFDILASLAAESKDLGTLMASPSFHEEQKKHLISDVFSGKLNELTMNFLMVAIEHNRMRFLPNIIAEYIELWEAHHGLHRVKVVVSKAIETAEVERLKDSIAAAINGQVRLEVVVNPAILGGIIIRHGSKVIDNSIRNRLQLTVKEITKQRGIHGV